MQTFGKKSCANGRGTNVIRLTDARRPVVSRKPTRNIVWNVVTFPWKVLKFVWDWIMESKPAAYPGYRRK
jgi:hypothetical protein